MPELTTCDQSAPRSGPVEGIAYGLAAVTLACFDLLALLLLMYNLARVADKPVWPVGAGVVACGLIAGYYVRHRTGRVRPAILAGLSLGGWVSLFLLMVFAADGW